MVNLLLFGTSFTKQPRIKVEDLVEASRSGVLRTRVDDLVTGLNNPGSNERLVFLRRLLDAKGVEPGAATGKFLYSNLTRVMEERRTIAQRVALLKDSGGAKPEDALDRTSLFSNRGVSLDTGIIPNFAVEQTLGDLKSRGVLHEVEVRRVAVVGPGLDFSDKNDQSSFDYYPQQTLQPFAVYDSLVRLGLAKSGELSVAVFDISARVIDHLHGASARARKGAGYTIQLPRDVSRPWPPELVAYWRALGDRTGTEAAAIHPPALFGGLETRAVRIRPEAVLACEPTDLNIVVQRLNLSANERFDVIVATNIFVYYDSFDQSLALENAGAMLKPGGVLLTNDRLPEAPGGTMHLGGSTNAANVDTVGWYRKN